MAITNLAELAESVRASGLESVRTSRSTASGSPIGQLLERGQRLQGGPFRNGFWTRPAGRRLDDESRLGLPGVAGHLPNRWHGGTRHAPGGGRGIALRAGRHRSPYGDHRRRASGDGARSGGRSGTRPTDPRARRRRQSRRPIRPRSAWTVCCDSTHVLPFRRSTVRTWPSCSIRRAPPVEPRGYCCRMRTCWLVPRRFPTPRCSIPGKARAPRSAPCRSPTFLAWRS